MSGCVHADSRGALLVGVRTNLGLGLAVVSTLIAAATSAAVMLATPTALTVSADHPAGHGNQGRQIPIDLLSTFSSRLGHARREFWLTDAGQSLEATAGAVRGRFTDSAAIFSDDTGTLRMSLAAFGA